MLTVEFKDGHVINLTMVERTELQGEGSATALVCYTAGQRVLCTLSLSRVQSYWLRGEKAPAS